MQNAAAGVKELQRTETHSEPHQKDAASRLLTVGLRGCRALDSFPDRVGNERMGQKLSVKRDLEAAVTSSWASP